MHVQRSAANLHLQQRKQGLQKMIDYSNKTVDQLRAIAKERKLTGYSKMRKAELISALQDNVVVIAQGNRKDNPEVFEEAKNMEGMMIHAEVPTFPVMASKEIGQIVEQQVFGISNNKQVEDAIAKMDELPRPMNRHRRRKASKDGIRRKSKPLVARKFRMNSVSPRAALQR